MSAAAPSPTFVCQVNRVGQNGPVAPWITMAGWAQAAARQHGSARVVTPEGVLDPTAVLQRATQPTPRGESSASWRRRLPEPAVTLAKDLVRVESNRSFWKQMQGQEVVAGGYVFQLHGLLWDAGLRLARRDSVPSVLVVDACQVHEARSWGIRRRGYARLAERVGEMPQLRAADLVLCVSDEVADQVVELTGRRDGVVVVSNGVDIERFQPGPPDHALLEELGIPDSFVVGWTGSFRSFHGLESMVEAVALASAHIPDLVLLMIGDGQRRAAIESTARDLGVRAVFPGTVGFESLPRYLRLFDLAVVWAPSEDFHYSPVKLREYQASGLPVVAAAAGEMARQLGDSALLVRPGDATALARALEALAVDEPTRAALGRRAREHVDPAGSWDARLATVERHLGLR